MALTDHDTIDGWEVFKETCAKHSIRPVMGVELSSKFSRTVHVLGYRMSRLGPFEEVLASMRDCRGRRNERMLELLRELGLDISMEDIEAESGGSIVARPHFASALVRKGYAPDSPSAFSKYLRRGAPAYAARDGLSPSECVAAIRDAGGLPVLAHPSLIGYDDAELGAFLEDLKRSGLWGLECISSHCSPEEAYRFLAIADEHGLFPTAGSDFHGSIRPSATLGVQVSDDFLPWARLGISL
jgi:predicted metal-dependent phosphoesterase TrpH